MRFLAFFGKFLISVGVGVLLFVAWTLWGTGLYTDREQDRLSRQLDLAAPVGPARTDKAGFIRIPGSFRPEPGSAVFRLKIPAIDLNSVVVEGVGTEELRSGPGHYPNCRRGFDRPLCTEFDAAWPGEKGRVIVSGHRTTYGAPFWDLDKLRTGDEIVTESRFGDFTYEVTKIEIVDPDSLAIVIPSDEAEIVLTTCNPKFSAAQRLIVFARMARA